MMKRKLFSRAVSIALCVLLCIALAVSAAAAGTCRTGTATGHYRNPQTDEIEDSGGEENEALGQSMVDNVVADQALLEEVDGQYYMTLRFNLASNLSSIDLYTQEVGETEWTQAETTVTGEGDDTRDVRIPVRTENTIVRAECFVDAMGRAVIFFITVGDYTDGNSTEYAEMTEADVQTAANTASAADTASAAAVTSVADDPLNGAEGLTIGGTDTAAAQTTDTTNAADTADTETAQTAAQDNTVDSATLTLARGVWWRIFLVAFCGCFLAGLVLQGLTRLTDAVLKGGPSKKTRKHSSGRPRYADDPDDDENGDILSDDLWGNDDES